MRLQRANRIITIFVASLSLASVACVLVSGYFRHRQATALNARTQSLLLSIQFFTRGIETSDGSGAGIRAYG